MVNCKVIYGFGTERFVASLLASPSGRSYNRWICAGAYALPYGTLLPSVATSHIPQTVSDFGLRLRPNPRFARTSDTIGLGVIGLRGTEVINQW